MSSRANARLAAGLLLVTPASGWAERPWLDAEIRAQEAHWAAQQGRTAPLQPVGVAALPTPMPPRPPVNVALQPRVRAQSSPPVALPSRSVGKSDISRAILTSARQHRLDPLLIRAVMLTESAGKPRATSAVGALGLMQLMPGTAARFGVFNPYDPDQSITGGACYLRWLLNRYGGNVSLALAGYNAGEGAVDRHGGIPPYRETQNYIKKVQFIHQFLRRTLASKVVRAAQQ